MIKFFRRLWAYLGAGANQKFNEKADPKIQLQQAIDEAKDQHRRLKEHAANVIAARTTAERQLERHMEELEKLNANARQAVIMADEATKAGDTAKAAKYTAAAETIATQLISVESAVDSARTQVMTTTRAAEEAHAAVAANSRRLQDKITEQRALLTQLEQAKMQEQINKAMASLTDTTNEKVPTLNEVRDKIEQRHARAMGTAELQEDSVEASVMEIEEASMNVAATSRLDEIRAQLGIETVTDAEVIIDAESEELPAESVIPSAAEQVATATEPATVPATQTSPGS